MIRYAELARKPSLFQSFTGLRHEAFQELLVGFEDAYGDDLTIREQEKEKSR